MVKVNKTWNLVRDNNGIFWMFNLQTREKITEEEYEKRLTNN